MAAGVGEAVVSSVASKVAESMFDTIKRHISYVFKYQSYMDDLKNQVKDLEHRREMVEVPVNHAKTQGDEIYEGVQDWLISVNKFTADEGVAKSISAHEDAAKKRCFKGLCPNLFKRYNLSKKAVKAAKDCADLLGKGNFSNVSYRPATERSEFKNVIRGYQQFDSRMTVFKNVMEVLKDSKVNMIGVYGMGGVGKTTLVKEVRRQAMEEKLFHEVAMAEVTQTPDLKTIQDKIAYDLGLSFDMHENVHERAGRLCRRLKNENRVLVILDNIWAKLDLETVGIPSGGDEQRQCCTILLTSRDQHLLCNEMNSQKNFSVEVLSEEESRSLFWKTGCDHFTQTSDFQHLAPEIVGKCGGLPIAILTIANALKNKKLSIWNDTLDKLRNSNPRDIPGMEKNVYLTIKLSYDLMESEEVRSLFRLCALQNDGSQIPIDDLIMYGMSLGWFKNVDTVKKGRNRVHALIENLKTSSLLLDGDNKHVVKMHDIIHAVAVSIAAEEHMFNIQDVDDLKEELDKVMQKYPTAISLPYREIDELPERLECPTLELFLLFAKFKHDGNSLQISDLFFEGMKELRVLHLTSFVSISSSLGCLTNLRTLSLNYFNSLEDVAIIGKLTKLQILSFHNSNIKQLPLEIGQLTRLKLLDLSNCWSLEVIAPNVISKLSRLEELYMGNSFTHWEKGEGGSNSSLDELKALSKLTTLDVYIPNVRVMPRDLVAVELERYKICIGDDKDWSDSTSLRTYERVLKLKGLDKSIILGSEMKKLLKNIEYLLLNELNGFQNVVNELHDREDFQQLKHLRVENDSEILYIVNPVGQIAFPLLESLFLRNLTNLEKVCQSQLTEYRSFSKLRIINVEECHRLEHLFSFSKAQNCFQLQEIEVTKCKNLKMIVAEESENHIVRENESINFSQLQSLKLVGLPKLTSLGFDQVISRTLSATPSASKEIVAAEDREDFMTVLFNNKVIFPALEKLELHSINIGKIWLDPFSTYSCQNLTEMRVENCSRLKFLFSYSMVNSLVKLQNLEIRDCESMERVIDSILLGRDEEQMIDSKVFPKLEYLELYGLPKLTGFMSMSMSSSESEENNILHIGTQSTLFDEKRYHQLTWDSFSKLNTLEIYSCDKLTSVFSSSIIMGRRFERLEVLTLGSCNSIEVIIEEETSSSSSSSSSSGMFDVLPGLIKLHLSFLSKLKSIYEGIHILECPTLKDLEVSACDKVEILLTSSKLLSPKTDGQRHVVLFDLDKVRLPSLEKLRIDMMNNLRKIWQWHPKLTWDSFSKLMSLNVCRCSKLTSVFSLNIIMGRKFERLEDLYVSWCDSIEEIIEEDTSSSSSSGMFNVLPGLIKLHLSSLPKLKSIYQGIHILEWPAIKDLYVSSCRKVEILFAFLEISELLESQQPIILVDHRKVVFPNLKTLQVEYCHGLRNLVTLSAAESQVKLARMEISICKMIKKIIEIQVGEGAMGDPIVFSELEYLELDNLPTLESFCLENYTLKFPYLEQVIVTACPSMKTFSQGILDTPMLHQVQLRKGKQWEEQWEERWEGNLNSTIQKLFEGMDRFCGIKVLKLSEFPSLKEIWDGHAHALPVSFFSSLTSLVVDDCTFMSSAIPTNMLQFLNNMRNLVVKNCDSIEEVIHLEELNADEIEVFPRLRTLKLVDLLKLKRFCNDTGNIRLHILWIENCPIMETCISNSTPEHMTTNIKPQEMTSEENFLTDIQPFFNEKVVLFNLQKLKLFKLPKLLHLWKENSHPSNVLEYLEILEISECHKLRQLVPSSITFENLTTLKASKCDGLINLVTVSTAKSLANLTEMNVNDCKMIEEIIQQVGEEAENDCIVFNKLQYLELSCLPSLTSFCLGNYTLEFPSLEHVFVKECPKMEIFFGGVLRTPKLQRVQLTELDSEKEGHWEGSLNFTIQKLFQEMNSKEEN